MFPNNIYLRLITDTFSVVPSNKMLYTSTHYASIPILGVLTLQELNKVLNGDEPIEVAAPTNRQLLAAAQKKGKRAQREGGHIWQRMRNTMLLKHTHKIASSVAF